MTEVYVEAQYDPTRQSVVLTASAGGDRRTIVRPARSEDEAKAQARDLAEMYGNMGCDVR